MKINPHISINPPGPDTNELVWGLTEEGRPPGRFNRIIFGLFTSFEKIIFYNCGGKMQGNLENNLFLGLYISACLYHK